MAIKPENNSKWGVWMGTNPKHDQAFKQNKHAQSEHSNEIHHQSHQKYIK